MAAEGRVEVALDEEGAEAVEEVVLVAVLAGDDTPARVDAERGPRASEEVDGQRREDGVEGEKVEVHGSEEGFEEGCLRGGEHQNLKEGKLGEREREKERETHHRGGGVA